MVDGADLLEGMRRHAFSPSEIWLKATELFFQVVSVVAEYLGFQTATTASNSVVLVLQMVDNTNRIVFASTIPSTTPDSKRRAEQR